jgi:hydroxypyruvate reductase
VIADNSTLVRAAAEIAGWEVMDEPLNDDVDDAARLLHARLQRSVSFVAGGEPTVIVRGAGRGGRCSELAVRFARLCIREGPRDVQALFASSDGVDGNSGCAGFVVSIGRQSELDEGAFRSAIARSDTYSLAASIGEPVLIPPTGNNLRDLFIVARPSHATG